MTVPVAGWGKCSYDGGYTMFYYLNGKSCVYLTPLPCDGGYIIFTVILVMMG